MMTKNADIIPITYVGGTGGRFISTLLTMANQHRFEEIILSEHGNAHDNWHLPLPVSSLSTSTGIHIESLLNLKVDSYFNKPYFISCHILELLTIMEHFEKSIRVVYDEDDVPDIVMIFLGKHGIDDCGYTADDLSKNYFKLYLEYKFFQKRYFNLTHKEIFTDNVLFITWKELCYSSPAAFVNSLSEFTNIPAHRFSIDNVLKWRKATMDCLAKIKLILNTIQETNTWLIAHK